MAAGCTTRRTSLAIAASTGQPTKRDAARVSVVQRPSMAGITKHIMRVASVADGQLPATAPTAEQAGPQRPPVRHRTSVPPPAQILRHRLLDPFELVPAHVARVRVGNPREPPMPRSA